MTEETPQERLARLVERSRQNRKKPKPLHEALMEVSVADYDRLRSVVEAMANYGWQTVAATDEYDVAVPCPWCHREIYHHQHAQDCPTRLAPALLKQLQPRG